MELMLNSHDDLTNDIVESGIVTLHDLFRCVKNYRYERIDLEDLTNVWYQRKGTCSSKHAFIKHVAEINNIDLKLMLVLFKMNGNNTSVIKELLDNNNLEYIPEAHCVIELDNEFFDATSNQSSFGKIKSDIIETYEVDIDFIVNKKSDFHKLFLQKYMKNDPQYTDKSFDEVWTIREECVQMVSEH